MPLSNTLNYIHGSSKLRFFIIFNDWLYDPVEAQSKLKFITMCHNQWITLQSKLTFRTLSKNTSWLKSYPILTYRICLWWTHRSVSVHVRTRSSKCGEKRMIETILWKHMWSYLNRHDRWYHMEVSNCD